ncbi:hypothetical protein [Dendrosporobacter sp. 1207_IL3150]|uniref:hypothetical protein n=1 Tax=Dendrosporobacter sp. 1207_IL3150 TaxID=3084054 RepID=UPI002FD9749A
MLKQFVYRLNEQLTFRLLMIITFLTLIGTGNIVGIYVAYVKNSIIEIISSLIASAVYLVPAYGLIKLRPWARQLELLLCSIFVLLGLVVLVFDSIFLGVIIIMVHGLIALYLATNECKNIFINEKKQA